MNPLREAAQQALEALEVYADIGIKGADKTIDALRAALAEPQPFTHREVMQQALEWAKANSEAVFAGGGMAAVEGMNAWSKAMRAALAEPAIKPDLTTEPVGEVAEVAQAYDGKWTAIIVTGDVELQSGDKLFTAPQPKAEQRPPNCGTGFCSCIACPYVQPKAEPCGWQFFQDGKWHNGMDTVNHRANTEAAGIAVRNVYPEPQPRKRLTREQAMRIVEQNPDTMMAIRMTEAAHGIEAAVWGEKT
jgi:hypothetical protein